MTGNNIEMGDVLYMIGDEGIVMKKEKNGKKTGLLILRRMLGTGLFIGLLTFAKLLETLPVFVTVPSAILYLFVQYRLLIK